MDSVIYAGDVNLWTADQARKITVIHKSKSIPEIVNEIMNRIQSEAKKGESVCIVYANTLDLSELTFLNGLHYFYPVRDILIRLGYDVIMEDVSSQPDDWVIRIKW